MVRYGGRFFAETQINLGQSSAELVRKDTSMLSIRSKVYRTFVSVPLWLDIKFSHLKTELVILELWQELKLTMMLKTKLDENFLC